MVVLGRVDQPVEAPGLDTLIEMNSLFQSNKLMFETCFNLKLSGKLQHFSGVGLFV